MEVLKLIILSCQLGASGMGGEYNILGTILNHQEQMVKNNLRLQKECIKELIICSNRNSNLDDKLLIKCLSK